jgi:guanine nucleotide-binding protein subunit alpha
MLRARACTYNVYSAYSGNYIAGPDYDVDRGALFIQHKFALRNHNSAKVIYPHFTTATDTSNIQVVFQVVMDTVICENLHQVTLL